MLDVSGLVVVLVRVVVAAVGVVGVDVGAVLVIVVDEVVLDLVQ